MGPGARVAAVDRRARALRAGGRATDIGPLIETYEHFASCGQLLPEQVWDEADRPERSLRMGQPAGSAVPLVWAHAEYLKLLRSALDGKVFDRIDPVYERYCDAGGAQADQARRGDNQPAAAHPADGGGQHVADSG